MFEKDKNNPDIYRFKSIETKIKETIDSNEKEIGNNEEKRELFIDKLKHLYWHRPSENKQIYEIINSIKTEYIFVFCFEDYKIENEIGLLLEKECGDRIVNHEVHVFFLNNCKDYKNNVLTQAGLGFYEGDDGSYLLHKCKKIYEDDKDVSLKRIDFELTLFDQNMAMVKSPYINKRAYDTTNKMIIDKYSLEHNMVGNRLYNVRSLFKNIDKIMPHVKRNINNLKIDCPNCNSHYHSEHYGDNHFAKKGHFTLYFADNTEFKTCQWCLGKGELSIRRLVQMNKLKKENYRHKNFIFTNSDIEKSVDIAFACGYDTELKEKYPFLYDTPYMYMINNSSKEYHWMNDYEKRRVAGSFSHYGLYNKNFNKYFGTLLSKLKFVKRFGFSVADLDIDTEDDYAVSKDDEIYYERETVCVKVKTGVRKILSVKPYENPYINLSESDRHEEDIRKLSYRLAADIVAKKGVSSFEWESEISRVQGWYKTEREQFLDSHHISLRVFFNYWVQERTEVCWLSKKMIPMQNFLPYEYIYDYKGNPYSKQRDEIDERINLLYDAQVKTIVNKEFFRRKFIIAFMWMYNNKKKFEIDIEKWKKEYAHKDYFYLNNDMKKIALHDTLEERKDEATYYSYLMKQIDRMKYKGTPFCFYKYDKEKGKIFSDSIDWHLSYDVKENKHLYKEIKELAEEGHVNHTITDTNKMFEKFGRLEAIERFLDGELDMYGSLYDEKYFDAIWGLVQEYFEKDIKFENEQEIKKEANDLFYKVTPEETKACFDGFTKWQIENIKMIADEKLKQYFKQPEDYLYALSTINYWA